MDESIREEMLTNPRVDNQSITNHCEVASAHILVVFPRVEEFTLGTLKKILWKTFINPSFLMEHIKK